MIHGQWMTGPDTVHMQTSQDVLNCLLQLNHSPSAGLRKAAHAWASEPEGGSLGLSAASLASLTASGSESRFAAQIKACSKLAQVIRSSPLSHQGSPHSHQAPDKRALLVLRPPRCCVPSRPALIPAVSC